MTSNLIVVDVEADGPYPGDYSMVCFGAVVVEPGLNRTFYGEIMPLTDNFVPEALAVSGFTRQQHQKFDPPIYTMTEFVSWLEYVSNGRPIFISDNLAFDWMWINYYLHKYAGRNPFGYSGRRIGDLYAGLTKNMRAKWKHLRKTHHDHNPVNDAKGNAEAILHMVDFMGLKL